MFRRRRVSFGRIRGTASSRSRASGVAHRLHRDHALRSDEVRGGQAIGLPARRPAAAGLFVAAGAVRVRAAHLLRDARPAPVAGLGAGRRRSARHLRALGAADQPQRNAAAGAGARRAADGGSGEADDKIIAVLDNDYVYADARDIADLPTVFVERLQHYFQTYKLVPGQRATADIRRVYPRAHAVKVVRAAMADYIEAFGA